jgi:hypothetical protein
VLVVLVEVAWGAASGLHSLAAAIDAEPLIERNTVETALTGDVNSDVGIIKLKEQLVKVFTVGELWIPTFEKRSNFKMTLT